MLRLIKPRRLSISDRRHLPPMFRRPPAVADETPNERVHQRREDVIPAACHMRFQLLWEPAQGGRISTSFDRHVLVSNCDGFLTTGPARPVRRQAPRPACWDSFQVGRRGWDPVAPRRPLKTPCSPGHQRSTLASKGLTQWSRRSCFEGTPMSASGGPQSFALGTRQYDNPTTSHAAAAQVRVAGHGPNAVGLHLMYTLRLGRCTPGPGNRPCVFPVRNPSDARPVVMAPTAAESFSGVMPPPPGEKVDLSGSESIAW